MSRRAGFKPVAFGALVGVVSLHNEANWHTRPKSGTQFHRFAPEDFVPRCMRSYSFELVSYLGVRITIRCVAGHTSFLTVLDGLLHLMRRCDGCMDSLLFTVNSLWCTHTLFCSGHHHVLGARTGYALVGLFRIQTPT